MRAQRAAVAIVILFSSLVSPAQEKPAPQVPSSSPPAQTVGSASRPAFTVPAGTRISLALVRYFSAKSARPGDPIYLQTVFPLAANGKMLIPAGTYVQGTIQKVTRPKGSKDLIEVELQSATMIFANGYTVSLPVAVPPPAVAKATVPEPEPSVTPPGTYVDFTSEGMVIREGKDPNEKENTRAASSTYAGTGLLLVFQAHGYDDLLDGTVPADMTIPKPFVLDGDRVEEASHVHAAKLTPLKPLPPKICYTADSPGTPDIVIPGSPGTPDTIIPGVGDSPPTVIPGIPPSPPTVIPGTPGTAGTAYPCPR